MIPPIHGLTPLATVTNFPPAWAGQKGVVILRVFNPSSGFAGGPVTFLEDRGASGILVRTDVETMWGPPGEIVIPRETIQACNLPHTVQSARPEEARVILGR